MSKNPRFWRNVTLIALAHIALVTGLIHWSLAARSAPDAESLVWLNDAEDLVPRKSGSGAPDTANISASPIKPEPLKPDDEERRQPALTQAKSEIELASPTSTPKPTPATPPKTKAAMKPTPRSTPRKAVLAKASKSSVHPKSSLLKSEEQQTENSEKKRDATKIATRSKSSPNSSIEKTGSAGKAGGQADGGASALEFGWYGNMLHDRFYSAWVQPTTTVASGVRISTLVKVRIEKDGRVSKFDIIKPSENVVVNESVAAIAKRVTEVDPPPAGLGNGNHYDVKINFELNTSQETTNQ
jgi:outer membrane biosynthesis protein TonB